MTERMCAWANCHNETPRVSVFIKGDPGERMAYCCIEHAAADLNKMVARKGHSVSSKPRCTCAAIVNPNIPHARFCPLYSTEGK